MNPLLIKTVAVFHALLLALPAGWCCVDAGPREDVSETSAAACPACAERGAPRERSQAPSPQRDRCCCELHSAIFARAEQSVPDTDADVLAEFPAVELSKAVLRGDFAPAVPAARGGPRLHVLQCVWLC